MIKSMDGMIFWNILKWFHLCMQLDHIKSYWLTRTLPQVYGWDNLLKPRQWKCHLNEATSSGCDLGKCWNKSDRGEVPSFLYTFRCSLSKCMVSLNMWCLVYMHKVSIHTCSSIASYLMLLNVVWINDWFKY